MPVFLPPYLTLYRPLGDIGNFYGNHLMSRGSRQRQELASAGRSGAGAGPGELWLVEVKQVVGRH
jgi:hypothetical protein